MYRLNVYNMKKQLISSREVVEYPTMTELDSAMEAVGGNGFVDICRCKDDGLMEHELGFTDDLQVDLIEGDSQYA